SYFDFHLLLFCCCSLIFPHLTFTLFPYTTLFRSVNFPFCTHNELYQAVIEDNIETKSAMMDATEEILQQTIQQNRQEFLEKEINEALEQKNYEAFMYYSSQLKEIKS